MTETKTFGVADILTHTTGRLLTPIGDVYLFLEWVTGEQGVMTHQLPRLSREGTGPSCVECMAQRPHRLDSLRFPVRILTRVTPPAGGAS